MIEQNIEYLVTVANAVNGLDSWELEVFNDSFRKFIKNPTKDNREIVSSNLAELVEKLTTITEAEEKVQDEEELKETKRLLEEYIRTVKYGYGYSDILNQVKKAYNVVVEYFKSRGFVPIKEEKTELSTQRLGTGKLAADEILREAKEELGYDVYQKKEETFEELLDRRLREALQKLKRRRESEIKCIGGYGSRGPQWWVDMMEAKARLSDKELHELADNSKEREEKASKRGADKILADYQRSSGD